MIPFLKLVANAFVDNKESLDKITFVFPNRRSGLFFSKYLGERFKGKSFILPEIITISELISDYTKTIEASRMEQLFALYSIYKTMSADISDPSKEFNFDQFIYWGDMILSDFNDVDRYMVDAKALFLNVKDFKDISANYLNEKQLEVIRDFWGEDRLKLDSGHLWKDTDSEARLKFTKLWEVLYPLYMEFNKLLASKNLSYSGKTYRLAAEKMKTARKEDFNFSKIVFVGFSTLSKSEEAIFRGFQRLEIGDFYWDYNSPVFLFPENKGNAFLPKYIKEFPSKYDLKEAPITEMPNIEIMSVPSGGGQAKVVGKIISDLKKEGRDKTTDIDTAVVLPEEIYLNSVIYSMPETISALNITMGYPMRNTSIASFMSMLSMLHSRKRIIEGEACYYYDDLEALLSHPYIKHICKDSVDALKKQIINFKYFFVPQTVVTKFISNLEVIFSNQPLDTPDEIIDYVEKIIKFVMAQIYSRKETGEEEKLDIQDRLELSFINQYENSLSQMRTTMEAYKKDIATMKSKTFFLLLERMLAGSNIAFVGEPLNGLQVMGVLETRLLDFENVIILSMNERIFPSKHFTKSFIPMSLRAGYGLSTYEFQESMFTYYFYRMISRAKNVYLLYDSRTQGISSGEQSRYIYQLQRLYNVNKCKKTNWEYNVRLPKNRVIEIRKNDQIMKKLNLYLQDDSKKNFSASMLSTYINCPLQWYLQCVEGLTEEDEISEFIDASTLGTIVHETLQDIYDSIPSNEKGERLVQKKFLTDLIESKVNLNKFIVKSVNKNYNKLLENDWTKELQGDALLIFKTVYYYVKSVLEYDSRLTPFVYIASEFEQIIRWNLGKDTDRVINFKFKIDRIDRLSSPDGDIVRIIDYKTGSDPVKIGGVDSMFVANGNEKRAKAIAQLLLYCHAYEEYYGGKPLKLRPLIYQIRSINEFSDKEFSLNVNKNDVKDFRDIDDGFTVTAKEGETISFMDVIKNYLDEIFNKEEPFRQTEDEDNCVYCPFKDICGRK